ncbi:EamA family transporter [uncultured Oscillibacter sp.]|uniref:EamA family transporter n=1 Tax=uncultured Oscillibacter sp. TaxID=876091 RepID=UPI0025DCA9AB|nr:EamA family transporter [uncultured Oscillibacter sp.]
MWLAYAAGSALLAGATAVLAKCGIRRTDSTVATAIRTVVVLACAWGMTVVTGSHRMLSGLDERTLVLLALSGLATGGSWLCYFRALQLGPIHQVAAVDKSSVIVTVVLAWLLLGEPVSPGKAAGLAVMGAGTWLMVWERGRAFGRPGPWLAYAAGSALFAALTAILGKLGMAGVESNLGTALRTAVVLVLAWGMVFLTGKQHTLRAIPPGELGFLCLSGLATGGSWLCYYRALQEGPASVVVPVDKLSILVTVAFSALVLHERLERRGAVGLALVTAGTLLMLL